MKAVLRNVNDVYYGASSVVPSRQYTSLAHLPRAGDVTKEEFAFFAALVCITVSSTTLGQHAFSREFLVQTCVHICLQSMHALTDLHMGRQ